MGIDNQVTRAVFDERRNLQPILVLKNKITKLEARIEELLADESLSEDQKILLSDYLSEREKLKTFEGASDYAESFKLVSQKRQHILSDPVLGEILNNIELTETKIYGLKSEIDGLTNS